MSRLSLISKINLYKTDQLYPAILVIMHNSQKPMQAPAQSDRACYL